MKKTVLHYGVFCAAFLSFSSCEEIIIQTPVSTKIADNNKDYRVAFLFEHDGCKVYRFFDRGESIYFTSCNGETMKAQTDTTGVKRMQVINKNRP